jgi:septum formation protein
VRLYLASTSPARLALLRAAGIEPDVVPSNVDEDVVVRRVESERGVKLEPPELVQLLARTKAEAVVGTLVRGEPIDGFIVGGDSAFVIDGEIYGKPHTSEVARDRWHRQRGRTGHLHSGHWLIDHRGGVAHKACGEPAIARVSFVDDLTDAEIDAYIATGEPLKVAGSFTIDGLGGPLITTIDGDPSTVVGLSLSTLRRLTMGFNVPWHHLWNRTH